MAGGSPTYEYDIEFSPHLAICFPFNLELQDQKQKLIVFLLLSYFAVDLDTKYLKFDLKLYKRGRLKFMRQGSRDFVQR
jgi:hypothetical protein